MDDESAREGAAADGVIAQLREGGSLHSEGRFTMDRETARERLGAFELPDASWSLLLLVRAAVRRGATTLDIQVDADNIRILFDGPTFDEDDFENLYHDSFSEHVDEKHAGRLELALGLSAALALKPRHIRIRSGTQSSGAELELLPGEPDRYGPAVAPRPGTEVHIKLRKGMVARAMASYGDVLPEVALLQERCRYADIPVTLNGERISYGLMLPDAVARVALDEDEDMDMDGVAVAAGFWLDVEYPWGVRVVKHGVWIADLDLIRGPRELGVVVRDDGVQTDLTQFGLVQGAAHAALVAAADRGWRAAVQGVIEHLENPGATGADRSIGWRWYRQVLREASRRFNALEHYVGPKGDGLAMRLLKLPIWETLLTAGHGGGYRSLGWLLDQADEGEQITCLSADHDVLPEQLLSDVLAGLQIPCVLTHSSSEVRLLRSLLGDRLMFLSQHPRVLQLQDTHLEDPERPPETGAVQTIYRWVIGFVLLILLSLLLIDYIARL